MRKGWAKSKLTDELRQEKLETDLLETDKSLMPVYLFLKIEENVKGSLRDAVVRELEKDYQAQLKRPDIDTPMAAYAAMVEVWSERVKGGHDYRKGTSTAGVRDRHRVATTEEEGAAGTDTDTTVDLPGTEEEEDTVATPPRSKLKVKYTLYGMFMPVELIPNPPYLHYRGKSPSRWSPRRPSSRWKSLARRRRRRRRRARREPPTTIAVRATSLPQRA